LEVTYHLHKFEQNGRNEILSFYILKPVDQFSNDVIMKINILFNRRQQS